MKLYSVIRDGGEPSIYMHINHSLAKKKKKPTAPQPHLSSGSTALPREQSQAQQLPL